MFYAKQNITQFLCVFTMEIERLLDHDFSLSPLGDILHYIIPECGIKTGKGLRALFSVYFPGTSIPKLKYTSFMKNLLIKNEVVSKGFDKVLKPIPRIFPCDTDDINIEIISMIVLHYQYVNRMAVFMTCKKLLALAHNINLWNRLSIKIFGTGIVFGKQKDEVAHLKDICLSFSRYNLFSKEHTRFRAYLERAIYDGHDDVYFHLVKNDLQKMFYESGEKIYLCPDCGEIHERRKNDHAIPYNFQTCHEYNTLKRSSGEDRMSFRTFISQKNISRSDLQWCVSVVNYILHAGYDNERSDFRYSDNLSLMQRYKYLLHFLVNLDVFLTFCIIQVYIKDMIGLPHHSSITRDIIICIIMQIFPGEIVRDEGHAIETVQNDALFGKIGWTPRNILPLITSGRLFKMAEVYFGPITDSLDSTTTNNIYEICMRYACSHKRMSIIKHLFTSGRLNGLDEMQWEQFFSSAQPCKKLLNYLLKIHNYPDLNRLITPNIHTKKLQSIIEEMVRLGEFITNMHTRRSVFFHFACSPTMFDMFLKVCPGPDDKKLEDVVLYNLKPIKNTAEICIQHGLVISSYLARQVLDPDTAKLLIKYNIIISYKRDTLLKLACKFDDLELYDMTFSSRRRINIIKYVKLAIKHYSIAVLERLLVRNTTGKIEIELYKILSKMVREMKPKKTESKTALYMIMAKIIVLLYPLDVISKKDVYSLVLSSQPAFTTDFIRILIDANILETNLPFLEK